MIDGDFTNIAAYLPDMARRQPHTPALYLPEGKNQHYRKYSFQELEQESNRIACALESIGIQRGVRTALMVPPGLEFFALTFALFKVGAVPILIDPGIGIKNLKTCLTEAEPAAFIGVPKAQIARMLFGWGKPTLKIRLTVGKKLFWGGQSLGQLTDKISADSGYKIIKTDADETAAILFTSGSTGVPKGVIYTHGNFISQVQQLQKIYAIRPGEIDLPTFPLFALFAPALGMSSVIPIMDFTRPGAVEPQNIIQPIQQFKITTMFGSPALIDRVGRYGQQHEVKLPSLKRAISAGAPVSASVLERFCRLLDDNVQVFTPYGATESLPVCSIGSKEILAETRYLTDQGRGVCVGHPVPGLELKVIQISDSEIKQWSDALTVADGAIGELVVKGPQVTRSYYNRVESTALAKINDSLNGGFFHRMGDLGYRDEKGRIWFCGRKAHRVITAGQTFYTIPCEAVFNTHGKVYRSALVGIVRQNEVHPVICIELEQAVDKNEQQEILDQLKVLALTQEITRPIQEFLIHPSFPVDIRHNAKIFREKLALWAQEQLT